MFKPIKISDRIEKLRNIYKQCPVATEKRVKYYSGDRWLSLGFLEGWLANETAPSTRLRRSLAEVAELDASLPIIYEDELICGQLYIPKYTAEEQKRFDELSVAFHMSPTADNTEVARTRTDHIIMDFDKLLKVGVNGVLKEIEQKKQSLNYNDGGLYDFDTVEKLEFYTATEMELNAVLRLAQRYSNHALRLAENAKEPRKSQLIKIAENLKQVPANGAGNFYQAVQSVHFYLFNMFGLYPMGRPDRYFLPYYERDIKEGRITKEFAQELIDQLCLLVSTYVLSRAACGFIVGGSDENGNLVENELTYMFLTALHHIRMPDPNGALAVNKNTSKQILKYAVDVLADGITHPAFYNDQTIINGLIGYGIDKKDAVNYIHTTCAEMSICGKSRMYTTAYVVNMPNELLNVFSEGLPISYEDIENKYFEKVTNFVNDNNLLYKLKLLESARNGYQPMRASAFVHDCIESGLDVYNGGAIYSYIQPIFIGFSNLCDSLFAIKKLVYEEKLLTLSQFYEVVKNNYQGNEKIRQYIINKIPHYGNDNAEIDQLAKNVAKRVEKIFKNPKVYGASYSMPGTFSYINHAEFGEKTGATFDGRKSGVSLSDGCCPVQGMDRSGPTAMINSLTSWDQSAFLGGMVINVKFTKTAFDEQKRQNFLQIINAFIERGGIEMQVNCVDRATLEDALIHPENHGDLLVRIGGFSDYFVRQTPCLQQEIINRSQY